jgi:hypothetical protein
MLDTGCMFDLRINLNDQGEAVSTDGNVVRFGSGSVEAFDSKFIAISSAQVGGLTEIWVGEAADPFVSDDQNSLDRYRRHSLDQGVKIRLRRDGDRPVVEIARTSGVGCPIYIAHVAGTLIASWRFEQVAEAIPNRRPNVEACKTFIKCGPRPVREQIIEGLYMLWPGEIASFDDAGLTFEQAPIPDIVLPGVLNDNARVTEAFLDLLAQSLEPNLRRALSPLIEVSGGYDSSCVAIAARSIRDDLNSYGVIHNGVIGAQQRRRRSELVGLLKLNDFEASSYIPGPFESLKVEECTFTPFDDIYRLPCAYAVDAHPARGIDLIITGVGGDELAKGRTFHREAWEVMGSVGSSATDAAAGRSDMFMRRGIWLAQPCVSQAVVDFCRALPKKIRTGRMVNILALARAGLSDGFIFPRYHEHYGNVIMQEAALIDFDQELSESIVGDHAIHDISSLLERARDATGDGLTLPLIVELWFVMKLEILLRRYVD